jgi:riboflavin kinase/FMN adenylyltransferase
MSALAVGKFDALHLGHRTLAERAARLGDPVLVRLTGMAEVLGWVARPPLVAGSDRERVLGEWSAGLGRRVGEATLAFSRLRGLGAAAFIDLCCSELDATALVVGRDFRCGRDRASGVAELAVICGERGVKLDVVDPLLVAGTAVSSSRIRTALEAGDTAAVATCLGRPHRLVGTVRRGDGRGRQLGFPTANLGAGDCQAPAGGVYAALADLGGRRIAAAVNIGVLPTVGGGRPVTVEAHLVGWSGECYGAQLGLDLVARLRAERKFTSLDELRQQIARDVEEAVTVIADGG